MTLYFVYGKIIKYHKWRILLFSSLMLAAAVLITVQLQYLQTKAADQLANELTGATGVILYQQLRGDSQFERMMLFFNEIAFSIMGMSALGTLMLVSVPEDKNIKKRTLSAPVSGKTLCTGEILAALILIPFIWVIHTAAAACFAGSTLLSFQGLLMLLNILTLSTAGIGLAFLILRTTNDRITMKAALMGVIIIMCFISGGLIPDYYLGMTAKNFAVFTPVYWYVRANRLISEFQFPEVSVLLDILKCYALQIVFAVMFYIVAYADKKRQSR